MTSIPLNVALWLAQGFFAFYQLFAGTTKLFDFGPKGLVTAMTMLPRPLRYFLGAAETLSAIGLVLPWATGTLPWLTPLAAFGCGFIMLGASGFHLRAREDLMTIVTGLQAAFLLFIAFGRSMP